MSIPFKMSKDRLKSAAKSIEEGEKGAVYPSVITLPAGVPWFKVKEEGTYTLDILAFPVSNPNNPAVRRGEVEVGEFDFHLKAYVHQRQGEGSEDLLCLKDAGKRTCPCCEEFFEAKKNDDKDGQSRYRRTERSYMIVHDHKDGQIKVWDASAFAFTKELLTEANDDSNGGKPVYFFHPEEGKSVQFKAVPGSFAKSFDFKRIRFLDRDPKAGMDLHERTFSLDASLKVCTAEEMSRIMFSAPSESQEHNTTETTTHTASNEPDMDPDAFGAPEAKAVEAKAPEKVAEAKAVEAVVTGNKCPFGHTYGASWGDTPDCGKCKVSNRKLSNECGSDEGA